VEAQRQLAALEVTVAHDAWLYETHDRSEYVRARDAAAARVPRSYALVLYAVQPLEKEDAVDLLKAASTANPSEFDRWWIGQARLVTGDAAGAVQALTESLRLRPCGLLGSWGGLRVHALLAEALEQTGDLAGARREYERVLRAWGNAKPRSVTAERARARLAKLPEAP
jgi:cytochrome c-type biogenesis protein CcmH/NrfG